MSQLLPDGIDHLGDCPFPLHNAILKALEILSWEANCPPEEQPPKRIWLDSARLGEHWERINAERARKYGVDAPEGNYDENPLIADLVRK